MNAAGMVVAWAADLIFGARMRAAAESSGTPLRLVRNAEELLAAVQAEHPRLVVVDLEARGDPVQAIAALKADAALASIPVLAYASHVMEDRLAGARGAGADRVLARGAFARDLASILGGRQ